MSHEVRTIGPEEAPAAEELLRAAFAPYIRKLGRQPRPNAYDWLAAACGEARVYGAYRGNEPAGVAIVAKEATVWTVDQVAVAPSQQGKGIGSLLLQHIEADARRAGVATLSLDTAAIMTDLLRLYERHGFRETHRGLPQHGLDQHLRVFMTKSL